MTSPTQPLASPAPATAARTPGQRLFTSALMGTPGEYLVEIGFHRETETGNTTGHFATVQSSRMPDKLIADAAHIVTCVNDHDRLCAENAALMLGLEQCLAQLDKCRRYLPTHGSFGEEGISEYEAAQRTARALLATAPEGGL